MHTPPYELRHARPAMLGMATHISPAAHALIKLQKMASLYEGGQEEASQVLQRLSSATAELETGVKALGTQSDGIGLREDLNSKKDAILADIQTMRSILQSAKERSEKDKTRTLNLRYDRLSKDFKTVVGKAEAALRGYKAKLEQHRSRDYGYSETLTSSTSVVPGGGQHQQVTQDTAVVLMERNQQLQELQGNIEDLHDINKNIAMFVVEQGEVVDNVEANVDSAANRVGAGTKDLQKGSFLAKRKRHLIAAIVGILVGVVIVVVVVVIILGAAIGCSVNRCGQ